MARALTTRTVDIALPPAQAAAMDLLREAVADEAGLPTEAIKGIRLLRRSIDARMKRPRVGLRVEFSTEHHLSEEVIEPPEWPDVHRGSPVIIVGCGPAGLFAALRCIEHGLKPVVLDRGKDVRARRRDL